MPATKKQVDFLMRLAVQKKAAVTWDPDTLTKSEASGLIESLLSGQGGK